MQLLLDIANVTTSVAPMQLTAQLLPLLKVAIILYKR